MRRSGWDPTDAARPPTDPGAVPSEQAHVPAQQQASCQDARFPPAYADPRRSLHPVLPPPQGPREPVCLTAKRNVLVVPAAPQRLTSSRQFRDVVRRGGRAGTGVLVVHALPADVSRYGLVVNKAVGSAVTRNRVKRRLRSLVSARLRGDVAQAVVVRVLPAAASSSSAELAAALDSCLRRAVARQTGQVSAP